LGREQLELPGEGGSESLDERGCTGNIWQHGYLVDTSDSRIKSTNTWEFNAFYMIKSSIKCSLKFELQKN
jgi:hypothetical protein